MEKANVKKENLFLLLGAVLTAVLCGGVGALFYHTLKFANRLFGQYSWLIFLLPVGGLLTVLIYNALKLSKTDIHGVLNAVKINDNISLWLTPAVFIGTVITQLLGGSAGKEGAALQIGGSIGSALSRLFKLNGEKYKVLLLCGMSAVFASVFTLPLTALAFGLEIVFISRKFYFKAIFPLSVATFGAYGVARLLGVHPERFTIGDLPPFDTLTFLKVVALILICSAGAIIFCLSLQGVHILFYKLFKNNYLRVTVGGFIIIFLTVIIGKTDYNGGGMHIIEYVLNGGQTVLWAFALKILFTSITNASGFKGGEIVPALFVGATLGSSAAITLGLPPIFGAALGMVTVFCGTTKCMVAALFLGFEFFGFSAIGYFLLAIVVAQIVTSKFGIFNKNSKKGCNA